MIGRVSINHEYAYNDGGYFHEGHCGNHETSVGNVFFIEEGNGCDEGYGRY